MAEVVVHNKKPIFMKTKGFSIFLVVLLGVSTTIAEDSNISNDPSAIPLESGELLPHLISKKSDVLEGDGKKFSSILSLTSPLAKYYGSSSADQQAASSQVAPQVAQTSSSSQLADSVNSAQSETKLPGASLWKIVKNSFFPSQISRESTSSILPQLKTPKQAWDDFIANAKTGFKMSSSPFQSASTGSTESKSTTTTQQTSGPTTFIEALKPKNSQLSNIQAEHKSAFREERAVAWPVSVLASPEIAYGTVKLMTGLGKGLLTNYLQKGITLESPAAGYQPLHEKLRFHQGVAQVYKGKLRDLALLNFLHKDKKVSAIRNFFGDGGWSFKETEPVLSVQPAVPSQPVAVTSGWTSNVPAAISLPKSYAHSIPLPSLPLLSVFKRDKFLLDASIISGLIKAKFDIANHLLLAKFVLAAELIKTIPVAFEVKGHLLKAVLHFLAYKDKIAFFRCLKILAHSVWEGKRQFLQVLLNLTALKPYAWKGFGYGLKGIPFKHLPYGVVAPVVPVHPYGPTITAYSASASSYGTPPASSYGTPPAPSYGSPTAPSYGAPPAPSYGPPTAPSYGAPPAPSYGPPTAPSYGGTPPKASAPERNPLYSYPTNFDQYSANTYATLPPVVYPPLRSGRDGQSTSGEYSQNAPKSPDSLTQAQTPQSTATLFESFGSEKENKPQVKETFLTRFIKSLGSSSTTKRSPDLSILSFQSPQQETPKEVELDKLPKFSATLLGTGFARN